MTSWRDVLPVHPAAELFPMMSDAELRELADDVKKNGLHERVKTIKDNGKLYLLDGRNRLDAIELAGRKIEHCARRNVDHGGRGTGHH